MSACSSGDVPGKCLIAAVGACTVFDVDVGPEPRHGRTIFSGAAFASAAVGVGFSGSAPEPNAPTGTCQILRVDGECVAAFHRVQIPPCDSFACFPVDGELGEPFILGQVPEEPLEVRTCCLWRASGLAARIMGAGDCLVLRGRAFAFHG